MKKTVFISSISVVIVTTLTAFGVYNSNGYSGATGSPADGGAAGSCSGCHSGGATTPGVSITASPAFAPGNKYTPGITYTISVLGSGYVRYGFDLEILNSQSATATTVGDFGIFVTTAAGEALNAPVAAYPYSDVMHTTPRVGAFTVVWTAPASGTGYLYCALLGVNFTGSTSGDKVSLQTMTLTPTTATGISESLEDNSILNTSLFPNPCKESFNLTYVVEESTFVCVELFNFVGAKVADIINEKQESGKKEIHFDLPSNLTRGIYFVKFNMNNKSFTKKITVQ